MSPVHIRCASPLQCGTPGWSRTNTPPLKRRLLCQSSYRRMEPSAGVQPASRGYEARVLALDDDGKVVPGDRVERSSLLCENRVLPLDEPGLMATPRRIELRPPDRQSGVLAIGPWGRGFPPAGWGSDAQPGGRDRWNRTTISRLSSARSAIELCLWTAVSGVGCLVSRATAFARHPTPGTRHQTGRLGWIQTTITAFAGLDPVRLEDEPERGGPIGISTRTSSLQGMCAGVDTIGPNPCPRRASRGSRRPG